LNTRSPSECPDFQYSLGSSASDQQIQEFSLRIWYSDVTKVVRFVVLHGRVYIWVWAYQERVVISILDAHQSFTLENTNHMRRAMSRACSIRVEYSVELTFHSGPTRGLGQENQHFLFHRFHDHRTFDEEPITNALAASIEQHYEGRTSGARLEGGHGLSGLNCLIFPHSRGRCAKLDIVRVGNPRRCR